MRTLNQKILVGLVFLCLSFSSFAMDKSGQVQLKAGEMGFLNFIEMVSEKLDIQIDASGLGSNLGNVVIPDTGPVDVERAKGLILSTLYLQGYTWIHDTSTDLYRIMRQRDARDQETPMITEAAQLPNNDLLVTYLMRVESVSPEYIARIIRSFMPANSRIIPDEATRSVLITDSARNIVKLRKIIQQVDTPQTAKQSADWLNAFKKKAEANCLDQGTERGAPQSGILIALFSLMALVVGFLVRGYVIRRIEGGL